jgi:hypothetical protein
VRESVLLGQRGPLAAAAGQREAVLGADRDEVTLGEDARRPVRRQAVGAAVRLEAFVEKRGA